MGDSGCEIHFPKAVANVGMGLPLQLGGEWVSPCLLCEHQILSQAVN